MPTVAAPDGVRVAYEVEGPEGATRILLLHGTTGGATQWRRAGYVEALRARARPVAIDLRGRGGSDRPHDPAAYGITRHAEDALTVLDDLGADRADVWGWSMGGRAAFELAASHPHRVRGLIVTGASGTGAGVYVEYLRAQAERIRSGGMGPVVEDWTRWSEVPPWLREEWLRDDPLAIAASIEANAGWEGVTGRYESIGAPTLLLIGANEPILEEARVAAARIPDCALVELEGCDHVSAFTRTDLVLPRVEAFLDGLDRR